LIVAGDLAVAGFCCEAVGLPKTSLMFFISLRGFFFSLSFGEYSFCVSFVFDVFLGDFEGETKLLVSLVVILLVFRFCFIVGDFFVLVSLFFSAIVDFGKGSEVDILDTFVVLCRIVTGVYWFNRISGVDNFPFKKLCSGLVS